MHEHRDMDGPPVLVVAFICGFIVGLFVAALITVIVWPTPAHAQRAASWAKHTINRCPQHAMLCGHGHFSTCISKE